MQINLKYLKNLKISIKYNLIKPKDGKGQNSPTYLSRNAKSCVSNTQVVFKNVSVRKGNWKIYKKQN